MNQNIGISIKNARILKNLSQKELAKKIGISNINLSLIENDKANPSIDTLTKISKVLDIPIAYILVLGLDEKCFPRKIRSRYKLTQDTITGIVKGIISI
ncbi:helix-turn-helix domain-containing protein [Polaribacter sp.]|uniref:helix-turn-helix domain-containing protein n=1 Tax=Polaribacter sp. TaxID=1920175 RepID=UPI003F6A8BF0